MADKDRVCAVAISSTGKKKAKPAANSNEDQLELIEESEDGTLAIDDLDEVDESEE